MSERGDMFPVQYPDDTSPRHAPLSLDWTKRTEAPTMADATMIYVDLYGREVAEDDPAAQTKYRADELKALRKGGFFPKAPGAPDEEAADESHGTPVLNSGIGMTTADAPDEAVEHTEAEADDADDKPHTRRARR